MLIFLFPVVPIPLYQSALEIRTSTRMALKSLIECMHALEAVGNTTLKEMEIYSNWSEALLGKVALTKRRGHQHFQGSYTTSSMESPVPRLNSIITVILSDNTVRLMGVQKYARFLLR